MPTLHPHHVELPRHTKPIVSRVGQAPHRPFLYQVEFHAGASASRAGLGALLDDDDDDDDGEWSLPVHPRLLLDPRLQKLITAAASGWVVERYV